MKFLLLLLSMAINIQAESWKTCLEVPAYPFTVTKVMDGDTFKAKVEIWPGLFVEDTFRLYGIDTPEIHSKNPKEKAAGLKAKNFLIELLVNNNFQKIYLHPKEEDKYGRMLVGVTIWQMDDHLANPDVSMLMINNHHARKYDGGHKEAWVFEEE